MRTSLSMLALTIVTALSASWQTPATSFDPVGKWKVATTSDTGTPMSVSVDVNGKPGAYAGKAITSDGRELPLLDLATTPTGMIAVFGLPQGVIVVSVSGAQRKFTGSWGVMEATFGLTAERQK
jgi:hypothetical protein